jgi:hypothetical protein
MSAIDQLALDLPGLAVPPPDVLAGLTTLDRVAVLDVLTRLIVKTIAPELIAVDGEAGDE